MLKLSTTTAIAVIHCCGAFLIMVLGYKYYLGDGKNYFVYRNDIYNTMTIRADLFNSKKEKIATTLVKGGMIDANKRHEDVINEFELVVS